MRKREVVEYRKGGLNGKADVIAKTACSMYIIVKLGEDIHFPGSIGLGE